MQQLELNLDEILLAAYEAFQREAPGIEGLHNYFRGVLAPVYQPCVGNNVCDAEIERFSDHIKQIIDHATKTTKIVRDQTHARPN